MRKEVKRGLLSVVLAATMLCMLTGCEDEEDTGYSEKDTAGTSEYYDSFGNLGSASELEGKTVVLSIFADDSNGTWDFDKEADTNTAYDMLEYTGIATDWITENAAEYGCNAEFVYNWEEDDNLYYTTSVDGDLLSEDDCDWLMWEYIENNIDSAQILSDYSADNIVYLVFMNTPESLNSTSCTRNYYEGMEYPYEMCYIYSHCENMEEAPAAIAHEILHTYGAPDLYMADTEGDNHGITQEYVDECESTASNDIMYTTFDSDTQEPYYDKISNEFTELDAYYVGLTSSSDTVDEWGLGESEH